MGTYSNPNPEWPLPSWYVWRWGALGESLSWFPRRMEGSCPEGLSPVCTPPLAGGGKINTEFTKSGPVISPTAVKELLSAQSNGNQPGTLLLPCPRGLRSRCCWGQPARTNPTQSAANGTFSVSSVIQTNNVPPRPKASERWFFPTGRL